MWPDRVSNPGPLTYKSGVLPTALRGPASVFLKSILIFLSVAHSLTIQSSLPNIVICLIRFRDNTIFTLYLASIFQFCETDRCKPQFI